LRRKNRMPREITYGQAINEAMAEEMQRDPRVFTMGEDIRSRRIRWEGRSLDEQFPDRVLNTPISEPGFVGAGLGAALTGMRPIIQIMFADLSFTAMDQIANQVAKSRYMSGGQSKVPLVILIPQGASGRSAAQHSQSLEGLFIHIPGLKVVVPSTPYDAKG
jgi:pyruvate dehydrogenase E1 component beta subunit